MDKIRQDIDKIRETYYKDNKKNTFFNKSQKSDIAEQVCNNIDFDTLIRNSILVQGNTVTIEYPILKLFCHEKNYEHIVNNMVITFQKLTQQYGGFKCIINLDTFTISAAERHKKLIELFCGKCLNDKNINYSSSLIELTILNPPNIMDTLYKIFSSFIDPEVKNKIRIQK